MAVSLGPRRLVGFIFPPYKSYKSYSPSQRLEYIVRACYSGFFYAYINKKDFLFEKESPAFFSVCPHPVPGNTLQAVGASGCGLNRTPLLPCLP